MRCKQAQVYPRDFCRTICEGIAAQRRTDSMKLISMEVMALEELVILGHEELHGDHMTDTHYEAYDDVSKDPLTPSMVRKARLEELEYLKSMVVR